MNQQLHKAIRTGLWLLLLLMAPGAWAQVVISQIYGGGGNAGATFKNDFIELFNRGNTPVVITGWTVQYASATGSTWATTPLSGTISPGGYFLIQEAAGTGGTANLPAPDAVGSLNLSGTAGKAALVNVTTALSGTCPTGATIVDFVGFGATAGCFEGAGPTPAPSNTTAVLRASTGCTDANNNSADFAAGTPNPRNSASPANSCGPVTPVASLLVNPTTLTGFVATQGSVSNVQTYTVTGSNLSAGPVSVSATANIELSTNNSLFTPTLSLPTTASAISQVVYARLTNAAPTGAFSGTITNTANSTLTAAVTVSGQVNAVNAPVLSASPTTLSGFTATQGTASAAQTFTISGSNLSPSSFTATATQGVEVSLNPATDGYTNQFSFGNLPNPFAVQVYARLTNTAAVGPVSGSVVITGSNSTSAVVLISGTVSSTAPVSPYTPIATARAAATIGQTFTVQGRVTVSNQLGARQIYIQDATGGIAVYSGPSGPDFSSLVNIGDSVQTRGPVTVFNGYLELTGTNNFTVVAGAGTRVPTPVAITPDQLANYQGQLVSIANASITPVAATFTGNANYTITAGGQSATLRINANSPLSGAGQPANPVSVTGIADRFVQGATTTGTNGLQLQPRILADIPGATPATDLTCTIGSNSTLTRDQTLDIAAWNLEFFGADAGTISCPGGTTLVYNNFGPTDEAKQQANATTVLAKLNADIISAEEVSDITRFDAAVRAMPGSYSYVCSNRFSYYFQNECDQTPTGNPPVVFGPTRLAQKVCVIYNTATVTPVLAETKPLLDGKYNYPDASNWSSGRLPFLFVANVTINGLTQKIHVVALHAKSGSATADYNRRKQDIADLKAELDANYADAKIVILGDYNDKLNGSIAANQQSSYQPFVTDATNYSAITLPLENQGCSTFNSSASFIDHIIASSELAKGYVSNSAYVLQPFSIPNYGNTTSDHNPVEARFDLSQFVTPVAALTLVTSADPTQILTTGTTTLSATVTGGTAGSPDRPYNYTFTGPGTISQTNTSNTASVSGLSAGVQTFTIIVADATSPASQTVSGTISVTVTQANRPPMVINPIPDQTATVGQSFSVNIPANTFIDPDGDPILLTVGPLPPGLHFDGSSINGTPLEAGVSRIDFFAYDIGSFGFTSFTLTVNPAPVPPLSVTVTASPSSFLTTGSSYLSVSISGGTVPYQLLSITGPGTIYPGFFTVLNVPAGVQTFTVTVTDANSQTASGTVSVTVTEANTAPFSITGVTTVSCQTLSVGQRQVSFTPQYAGVSGQPISFSVVNELSPTTAAGPYTLNLYTDNPIITLKATQSGTAGEVSFSYNWLAACNGGTPPTNQAPVVANSIPAQTATAGQAYSYQILANTFSDPNGDALTLSVAGLPNGLTFNGTTISGTPSVSGVSSVTVTATDPGSLSANTTFMLTVNPAPVMPPTGPFSITGVTTISCTTISAGQRQLSFTPQYAGTSGQPISFSVVNELSPTTNAGPYTLNLYTDNPTITLKATQTGTAGEASFVYNWLAACTGPVMPPTSPFSITGVTTVSCQTLSAGQRQVSFTPQYAGTSGQPISFSVVNELSPTTNAGPYTLRLYTDNPIITLKATQSGTAGEASFSYNWLAACGSGARLRAEPVASLEVRVLGNPVQNGQVLIEVRGAAGQPVRVSLTDVRGQIVGMYQVERADSIERHRFEVGRQPVGQLLLRVTTPTQSQTVKVIRAD